MKRFGVTYLALPDFLVRGKVGPDNSVNVLIAFDCRAVSACYFDVYFCQLGILRCSVVLMTGTIT